LIPAAHSLVAPGSVAAPYSGLNVPAAGLVSADQVLPFQRRISPCWTPPLTLGSLNPTAYTSLAERAATAFSVG
jgi:hypothetical protein